MSLCTADYRHKFPFGCKLNLLGFSPAQYKRREGKSGWVNQALGWGKSLPTANRRCLSKVQCH